MVPIWPNASRIREDSISQKIKFSIGSRKSVWRWNMFTIEKSSTAISRGRTFFSLRTIEWNWGISVSQEFWRRPWKRRKQWSVRRTTSLRKSLRADHTPLWQIFGRLGWCCTNSAPSNLLSMPNRFISWRLKSSRDSINPSPTTTPRSSVTWSVWCYK